MEEALREGIFPGAAAGFLIENEKKREKKKWAFGFTDDEKRDKVNITTYYDLASLTKPFVTVLSLLVLFERKKIDLETNINQLIKFDIPYDKKEICIGDLMGHKSGLPGYRPYYEELLKIKGTGARKEKIVEYIINEELDYETGSTHIYSDLGFILLGEIVEKISKKPLDMFWTEEVLKPMKLQKKFIFRPAQNNVSYKILAATEKCPWSGKMLKGIVHDENCRALGGVAGHAGLFGTVEGVLDLCGNLLRQWQGKEKHPHYSSENLRKVFRRKKDSTWCYGFDTPSSIHSSSGRYFSDQSVGHLGFTGTSFWIDLSRGIAIALLTNRVHPSRKDERIKQFRPLFHDIIMKQVLDA
jgi:CubicO group peptidase (beta-lactamase class C family)